jgi:hypothetical protein
VILVILLELRIKLTPLTMKENIEDADFKCCVVCLIMYCVAVQLIRTVKILMFNEL